MRCWPFLAFPQLACNLPNHFPLLPHHLTLHSSRPSLRSCTSPVCHLISSYRRLRHLNYRASRPSRRRRVAHLTETCSIPQPKRHVTSTHPFHLTDVANMSEPQAVSSTASEVDNAAPPSAPTPSDEPSASDTAAVDATSEGESHLNRLCIMLPC